MSGNFEQVSRDVWAEYEAAVERTDAALAEFLAAHRPVVAERCSNVEWAAENDADVEWARWMWACSYDCADCRRPVAIESDEVA